MKEEILSQEETDALMKPFDKTEQEKISPDNEKDQTIAQQQAEIQRLEKEVEALKQKTPERPSIDKEAYQEFQQRRDRALKRLVDRDIFKLEVFQKQNQSLIDAYQDGIREAMEDMLQEENLNYHLHEQDVENAMFKIKDYLMTKQSQYHAEEIKQLTDLLWGEEKDTGQEPKSQATIPESEPQSDELFDQIEEVRKIELKPGKNEKRTFDEINQGKNKILDLCKQTIESLNKLEQTENIQSLKACFANLITVENCKYADSPRNLNEQILMRLGQRFFKELQKLKKENELQEEVEIKAKEIIEKAWQEYKKIARDNFYILALDKEGLAFSPGVHVSISTAGSAGDNKKQVVTKVLEVGWQVTSNSPQNKGAVLDKAIVRMEYVDMEKS